MKQKNRLLIATAMMMGLLGTTNGIAANNQMGAWTFTFADAYYHFDSKRHVDSTSMPNFSLGYNITPEWAVEGTLGVLNSNLSETIDTNELENDPVHGMLYTINGIYRFLPCQMLEPYVTGGIGVIGVKPSGNESVQQGSVNAGLGAQAFFDKSLALRAEIRDIYTTTGSAVNDYFINVGISYLIDSQ